MEMVGFLAHTAGPPLSILLYEISKLAQCILDTCVIHVTVLTRYFAKMRIREAHSDSSNHHMVQVVQLYKFNTVQVQLYSTGNTHRDREKMEQKLTMW